jgi:adenylylsulfate kinase
MGLPGSGKTTLAKKLSERLSSVLWLNADELREKYHDQDFTPSGRLRQAQRFFNFAEKSNCEYVICDFIAPLPKSREIYDPNYIIWMNTIEKCRFDDTNRLFVTPDEEYDYRIKEHREYHTDIILNNILQHNQ